MGATIQLNQHNKTSIMSATTKLQINLLTSKNVAKRFVFPYILKHKIVRDLKIVTETVGILEIAAVGYFNPSESILDPYDRYSVDIDFVRWNGADIKPVLEVVGGMEEITEAAIRYFAGKYEPNLVRA